jgi:hypothetical protein
MPFLAHHVARSWAATVYLATGAVVGTLAIVVLSVGLSVGIGLSIVGVGLPILALTVMEWRKLSGIERRRAALVLDAPIPQAYAPVPAGGLWRRWRARLADRATWRDLAWCLLLGPVGIVTGSLAVALWAGVLVLFTAPLSAPLVDEESFLGGLGAGVEWALALGGVVGAGAVAVFVRALADVVAGFAARLLAPDERALLAARVVSLEETRAGVVDSADGVLRRIERDLHDGAQHRLAYVAMSLGARRPSSTTATRRAHRTSCAARERSPSARWPSCATSCAASTRPCSPTAAWTPRSPRWPGAPASPSRCASPCPSARRRRSRPPRTSWWPRR